MDKPYLLRGDHVVRADRDDDVLTYEQVAEFVPLAIRRELSEYRAFFLAELQRRGHAQFTWNFLRYRSHEPYYTVTLTATKCRDGYYVSARTSSLRHRAPSYLTERVCNLLWQRLCESKRGRDDRLARKRQKKRPGLSHRELRKRKLLERSQEHRGSQPRTGKRRRTTEPGLSRTRHTEVLSRQFGRQHVFWNEATEAVRYIFQPKQTLKYSASELISNTLLRSFEESGGRYAEYSASGFKIRFENLDMHLLPDGTKRWKGDITVFSIWASKDNKHPLYRRMRNHLRKKLGYLKMPERREREEKRMFSLELPGCTIIMGGVRYAA